MSDEWIVPMCKSFAVELLEEEIRVIPVVWMEDAPVHTDLHPFCSDPECPCKAGDETFYEYIEQPIYDGLMTPAEGLRLFYDEQV